MKVLQINCVYKKGSTGKIVYDLHTAYARAGIASYVCYGRGERYEDHNVYKTSWEFTSKAHNLISRFTGMQYGGMPIATGRLMAKIKQICPDVVHLHCINGFFVNIYTLLNFLKRKNIPTVLTLHAEFMHTGGCGYALSCKQWMDEKGCKKCPQLREATGSLLLDRTPAAWKRMMRAFVGFDNLRVVSVSPWLEERARRSAILKDKIHSHIFNGIETEKTFCYCDSSALRENLGLNGKKVALYVTAAFNQFKGAGYILALAEKMPEVTFLVVGNREAVREHPSNLIAIGRVEDQRLLAQYYSLADITVLTSKKETFSMVCVESLCCGTPVVGFEAGAPETISLPEYSCFCPYGDSQQLQAKVKLWLNKYTAEDKQSIAKAAEMVYSKERMAESYLNIYNELLEKG